jgi:hypothetical protein
MAVFTGASASASAKTLLSTTKRGLLLDTAQSGNLLHTDQARWSIQLIFPTILLSADVSAVVHSANVEAG